MLIATDRPHGEVRLLGKSAPPAHDAGPQVEPVRLLLVVDSLEVGGAERHVVDLAAALSLRAHEVTVACSVPGDLSGLLEEANVPVRPLLDQLVKRRVSAAYARGLRRLVKEERFDLVHAHIYASAAAAAIATVGTGVPLVVTEHTEAGWRGRRARLVSRWFCRRASQVIAVSGAVRRRLVQQDDVPPEKIAVIPNAVPASPEKGPGAPPLQDELRDGPLVGVVARLQPEKGVATFLKAVARVAKVVPRARFIVAGDGPLRAELEALVGRLGLEQNVYFLGFRSDPRALIGLLDVLVVPSHTEGAPLVVLEAMAAGVPVVASAVGGIPDQVRHGEDGLLVPPGDPAALGDAVLELLGDPGLARRMGAAGSRKAATDFSHATMVERAVKVYRTALGLPPTSGATVGGPETRALP
jgi:glycosyltransferase involved in cell wall biosynthesis